MTRRDFTLIGAGLAGCLLALLLVRRGHRVRVFERRPDPRTVGYLGGRSINMALAERGLHALRTAELEPRVIEHAVMMRGRMIHELGDATRFMRYGKDDSEVAWSVHRGWLNTTLLQAAEQAGAIFHFNCALEGVDFETRELRFSSSDGVEGRTRFETVIGADGAHSALRAAMASVLDLDERIDVLGHGYKELSIPAASEGAFRIEPHAMHLWPRGNFLLIALPNIDGSFTVTLFLGQRGDPGFSRLDSPDAVRAFFQREFPDASTLMPTYLQDFMQRPVGQVSTMHLNRWHLDARALLIGDAAHAIVPFHGQGMNCAFEDCVELDRLLAEQADTEAVFASFHARRKPNTDAIADMALENFLEMREEVANPRFQLRDQLERSLAGLHPERFVSRYSMIMFHRIDYAEARRRGQIQTRILDDLLGLASDLDEVDFTLAESRILAELEPLGP